ncbi:hypothetical protein VTK73DRAFT_579 [Phialemonium thermophilum]|uniref:Uncharacterized protein n=1 Tax=Phialemonium thermophilum TaxID=223376 RepID=A0ABR3XE13_9PEZI
MVGQLRRPAVLKTLSNPLNFSNPDCGISALEQNVLPPHLPRTPRVGHEGHHFPHDLRLVPSPSLQVRWTAASLWSMCPSGSQLYQGLRDPLSRGRLRNGTMLLSGVTICSRPDLGPFTVSGQLRGHSIGTEVDRLTASFKPASSSPEAISALQDPLPGSRNEPSSRSGSMPTAASPSCSTQRGAERVKLRSTVGAGKIYLDPPAWPLESCLEANLLQHFINVVSMFFDFCDQDRHFATVVPQRARICRTLLNAIFALSARHLSRTTTDFPASVADRYYHACLSTLIPALDDDATVMDETLFVVVVILRLLEEFDVALVGADTQGHLLGAQSLTRVQERVGMDSGLRQAAYWACLRQEIYISLKHRHAVRLNLQLYRGSQAVREDDGRAAVGFHHDRRSYSLACVATLHCAEAAQFAFGEEMPRSRHKELLEYNNKMTRDRGPESRLPFYYAENGHGCFPDIRFATENDTIASQYFHMARILLITHDPAIPRMGPAHRRAMVVVEEEVRRCVKLLCGVGLSNPASPAAILIACMSISLCGDLFDGEEERQGLLRILEFTEKHRGWPTAAIQTQLKESWAWSAGS